MKDVKRPSVIALLKTNMKNLSKTLLLSSLLQVLCLFTARGADAIPQKPNIIFILADDLGIGSVSSYGADNFKTPNIDKLAESGIRFEHCYASPLCGPSRALLMTGRYGFRTGVTDNPDRLESSEIMMPKVLKQAGYVTAQAGKWSQFPLQPSDWGFDEYLRFEGSGQYWSYQPLGKTYTLNGEKVPLKENEYLPDRMHNFVVDFIEHHQDQPFYIYYSLSQVHGKVPSTSVNGVKQAQLLPTPDSAPGTTEQNKLYQDNVAYMDKLVGKLIAELNRLKLREKTIIIFAGDNGTVATFKEFCTINGGKQLSGSKHTMRECGALVPMMVSWPGKTPAGKVSQNLVSFCDFFPTLAELAGAQLPQGVKIDGKPFTPIFYGQMNADWLRDWIFVMLGNEWYARELNWKLNQSGELLSMTNAPFAEPIISAETKESDALAARKRLQTVLDQLNPTAGKVVDTALLDKNNKKKNKEKNQPDQDKQNANDTKE